MRHRASRPGFTLIEVLVAFTIAAVLLVALLRSFGAGLAGGTRADNYTVATTLAESALEALGTSEKLSDGFRSERAVGPYEVVSSARYYPAPSGIDPAKLYVVPYDVAVTVSWRQGPRAQSVTLRTIRLALRR